MNAQCELIGQYFAILLNYSCVRIRTDGKQILLLNELKNYVDSHKIDTSNWDEEKLQDFMAYYMAVRLEMIIQVVNHIWNPSHVTQIIRACSIRCAVNFAHDPDPAELMGVFYLIYAKWHNENIQEAFPDLLKECIRRSGFSYIPELHDFFYDEIIHFDALVSSWSKSLFFNTPIEDEVSVFSRTARSGFRIIKKVIHKIIVILSCVVFIVLILGVIGGLIKDALR